MADENMELFHEQDALPNLDRLRAVMGDAGALRIFAKILAANDNSKNQIYLGPHFELLPVVSVEEPRRPGKEVTFHASLNFYWLSRDGTPVPAPHAKLILYPQYPEVRLSGFLRGCAAAPNKLSGTAARESGHVLFLGITADEKVLAYLANRDSPLASQVESLPSDGEFSLFKAVGHDASPDRLQRMLIRELRPVYGDGENWIPGKILSAGGPRPYSAPNAPGYTLEAELGISPNGDPDPDLQGVELKACASGGRITLMTPEPTKGLYATDYFAFLRAHGRAREEAKLFYFTGVHRVGVKHKQTGLTLHLTDFDPHAGSITSSSASLDLRSEDGELAAAWPTAKLLEHWMKKHRCTAYVQYEKVQDGDGPPLFRYGPRVELGRSASHNRFLNALHAGTVYYDPGCKMSRKTGGEWTAKKRNQFRISHRDISQVYDSTELLNLEQVY